MPIRVKLYVEKLPSKRYTVIPRIVLSFRGNYSFLEAEVRQLFKGGNYSRAETIVFLQFCKHHNLIKYLPHIFSISSFYKWFQANQEHSTYYLPIVWVAKKVTKHSSNTLLHLVTFFATKTLLTFFWKDWKLSWKEENQEYAVSTGTKLILFFINWIVAAETIQGRKLIKGGNY